MRIRTLASIPILLALALAFLALPASAQIPPSVPAARFYGSVTVGGYAARAGASLTARGANGAYCGGSSVFPDGSYAIDIQPSSSCIGTLAFFVNGQPADQTGYVSNTLSGAVALNLSVSQYPGGYSPPPPPYAGNGTVTYQPGWNLIGVPPGTALSPTGGALYTWQPGDAGYETIAPGTGLREGYGYWALFTSPTTVTLAPASRHSVRRRIPPGQIAMIGNPFNQPATISGAATAYTYDPIQGYQATTVLQPGQGAWVTSNDGTVVIRAG